MKKHILIVDDDDLMRLSLKYILEREGYVISEAGDGNRAIDILSAAEKGKKAPPIDLILMDIVMPNKEGIETILEIREKSRHLKIIAMSGGARFNRGDPLKLAQDCGANFVIAKPFDPSRLCALVKMCF